MTNSSKKLTLGEQIREKMIADSDLKPAKAEEAPIQPAAAPIKRFDNLVVDLIRKQAEKTAAEPKPEAANIPGLYRIFNAVPGPYLFKEYHKEVAVFAQMELTQDELDAYRKELAERVSDTDDFKAVGWSAAFILHEHLVLEKRYCLAVERPRNVRRNEILPFVIEQDLRPHYGWSFSQSFTNIIARDWRTKPGPNAPPAYKDADGNPVTRTFERVESEGITDYFREEKSGPAHGKQQYLLDLIALLERSKISFVITLTSQYGCTPEDASKSDKLFNWYLTKFESPDEVLEFVLKINASSADEVELKIETPATKTDPAPPADMPDTRDTEPPPADPIWNMLGAQLGSSLAPPPVPSFAPEAMVDPDATQEMQASMATQMADVLDSKKEDDDTIDVDDSEVSLEEPPSRDAVVPPPPSKPHTTVRAEIPAEDHKWAGLDVETPMAGMRPALVPDPPSVRVPPPVPAAEPSAPATVTDRRPPATPPRAARSAATVLVDRPAKWKFVNKHRDSLKKAGAVLLGFTIAAAGLFALANAVTSKETTTANAAPSPAPTPAPQVTVVQTATLPPTFSGCVSVTAASLQRHLGQSDIAHFVSKGDVDSHKAHIDCGNGNCAQNADGTYNVSKADICGI